MRIGSDNSVYDLFVPKARKAPSVNDENIDFSPRKTTEEASLPSEEERIAQFYDGLASSQMRWADINKDGKVTRDEYLAGQARLADQKGYAYDAIGSEDRWSIIDPSNKGYVDEAEMREGMTKLFKVKIGHLPPGYRLPNS
ncbi:hypothetical protein FHX08_006071 [Rhizobium sp. BK529]|uniref:EF-hand domain-containing protein n=1 Tax=unclassified Rhizobium TaxID=2613769 RepID=UPI0010535E38|nr:MULTISPECIES: EF-hand domain-containing protein [unclassified Rhizobium]MBB3595654.1 hypothetical protein [Rhizobium sp. BK529]TCR98207.1 hypothetical protein EV281_10914 [Rhizobium sp. BK418]